LDRVVATGSRELFTLAVVAAAIGVVLGSAELFGVSFALGAFFAGMVVNASDHSERAAIELQLLQNAFTVLFFVSVGMLFDPAILLEQPSRVLVTVAIVIVGKSLAAFLIVRAFRYPSTPWPTSRSPRPGSASSPSSSPPSARASGRSRRKAGTWCWPAPSSPSPSTRSIRDDLPADRGRGRAGARAALARPRVGARPVRRRARPPP
jgi:Sodium/hydrogen exchanger family